MSDGQAMTQATVTVTLVCPHCGHGFPITEEHFLDAARTHIDAHTLDPDGEHHPPG